MGVIVLLLMVFFSGCIHDELQGNTHDDDEETEYQIISLGTIEDDAAKYIESFQPTADYIAAKLSDEETKYKGKVIIVKTKVDMSELLKNQELDLYLDSSFATVFVAKGSEAVPFLRRWRQEGAEYHSVFIVKNDSSINSLDDLVGKTIAFKDSKSTAGYLLPKAHLIAYLTQNGFNASQSSGEDGDIVYVFSGEDENTALWVVEGKVDAGALTNVNFEEQPESIKTELKIISRTIDVPRQMVSHRSELDLVLVESIKQILIDMDKDEEGIEILKNFENTTKYDEIPDKDELFSTIDEMLTLLG